ncbi:VanZ family protein [Streptomyces gancidicus BKS 13-15]|uniref:VanZ family protein n=1 Tax=Streptomyces gancidicus BKS 13-15 TaxID=1284664 RepID=M3DDK5_STREZ|nr:VanZ family protein [Streptomyces gancidicus]EMF27930.1 VanZ family protein [Streptomyces gancidicus BKS 13-15]
MIHAVFQGHAVFLALAVTVTLLAGAAAYFAVARRAGRARGVFCGLWASSVVGPLTLTTWSGSGVLTGECAINPSVLQAFAGVQGQLNVLLFVPFGVCAVLTTGRPFASLAAGVVLVAAVETSQAVVPFISRLCDSDDLVTNSAGVCAGVMLGVVVRRRMPGIRSAVPSLGRPVTQRALAGGAVVAALVVSAWLTVVHPVRTVLPTPVPAADAVQVQALNAALDEAFPGAYEVEAAEYLDDVDGEGMVTALLPGGFAEITWPDREQFTVQFTPTRHGEGVHAYEIPDVSRPSRTAREAKLVATRYAARYAPWALRASQVTVRAVDDPSGAGWVVEWRRWRGEVLMPMRLDIGVEPSGRLTDLRVRRVDDPALPQAHVGEAQAWETFARHFRISVAVEEREQAVLQAERRGGHWRIHWRLSAREGGMRHSAVVDATDGSIHSANSESVPQTTGPRG